MTLVSINSLAALRFSSIFGVGSVYQLVPYEARKESTAKKEDKDAVDQLKGRLLFNEEVTYASLADLFRRGAAIKKTPLTREFDFNRLREHYAGIAFPLFLITASKELVVFSVDKQPVPKPGQSLLSIVHEPAAREPQS